MLMLGMDMVDIFTNKPGLGHAHLDSKAPATDMLVMDTDMDTDMVMVMDMATTLERDLLNLTMDTHMPLAHTFLLVPSLLQLDQLALLDMELEPHSPPEAHKDSEARDPLNPTMVMDS